MEYREAIVIEHRQQPARLVGRQAIVLQCMVQTQHGLDSVGMRKIQMIDKLAIGTVGKSMVCRGFGTMDGQIGESGTLRKLKFVTLVATQHEADASETPQGILIIACATKTLAFIITVHAHEGAVIGKGFLVCFLAGLFAHKAPFLCI